LGKPFIFTFNPFDEVCNRVHATLYCGLAFSAPNTNFYSLFYSDKDREINEDELTGCILRKLGENDILNCFLK
jgi:hypothetical protein